MPKPPTTSGNQTISMSGVLGPVVLGRTGTLLEDFELYGSLHKRASQHYIHQRDDRATYLSSSTRIKAAPGAARLVIGPFLKTNHCSIAKTARMGELRKSRE